jgi:nucleoside-diphosphate-sugar epimerase
MRYDLVVNAFVKDALKDGRLTLHSGGKLWRPLIGIHDVARACVAILEATEQSVNGQIFNVVSANYQIASLASRVQHILSSQAIDSKIEWDDSPRPARSYRASGEKMKRVLGFHPAETIADSVKTMVEDIASFGYSDFDNPVYYNIEWFRLMQEAFEVGMRTRSPTASVTSFLDRPA